MKISASIFSDSENDILTTINTLNNYNVDFIHVDDKNRSSIFDDIAIIRENSDLPIDLHFVANNPKDYWSGIIKYNIEYVTFQYEDLASKKIDIPAEFKGKIGLGISTNTQVSVFEDYKDDFDFILIMATIPGESGGKFDKSNFAKIREFNQRYPDKKVHVDGGVDAEVSFILRNMGVFASVSGSYLFNESSVGLALLNLKLKETASHFLVKDFMRPIKSFHVINVKDLTLENLLITMNKGGLGFTIVTDKNDQFAGIIGNSDLRHGLLKNLNEVNKLNVAEFINTGPMVIYDTMTVLEMLSFINQQTKTVAYFPVINRENIAVGIVSFMNLIKGEL